MTHEKGYGNQCLRRQTGQAGRQTGRVKVTDTETESRKGGLRVKG